MTAEPERRPDLYHGEDAEWWRQNLTRNRGPRWIREVFIPHVVEAEAYEVAAVARDVVSFLEACSVPG